jgi:hypothetical protein
MNGSMVVASNFDSKLFLVNVYFFWKEGVCVGVFF